VCSLKSGFEFGHKAISEFHFDGDAQSLHGSVGHNDVTVQAWEVLGKMTLCCLVKCMSTLGEVNREAQDS